MFETLLLISWLMIGVGESNKLASAELSMLCLASNKSETICELTTEADKYLEWTWFEAGDTSEYLDKNSKVVFDGTLRLGIGKSAFSLDMEKLRKNLKAIHKAKVFLPFYPITSNDRCEFSFSYRVNERSAYVASAIDTPVADDPKNRWPKVSVILIKPKSEGHHDASEHKPADLAEVHLLNYFEHPGSYLADEFESSMLIGRQMVGSWTLAILIETRLDANFLEFTRMKLTHCAPTGQEMVAFALDTKQREIIDLEQAFATTCNNDREQFQCRLSGRCLSLQGSC